MECKQPFLASRAARDIRRKALSVEHRLVLAIALAAMTAGLLSISSRLGDMFTTLGKGL